MHVDHVLALEDLSPAQDMAIGVAHKICMSILYPNPSQIELKQEKKHHDKKLNP
jgi:hypothetical protein